MKAFTLTLLVLASTAFAGGLQYSDTGPDMVIAEMVKKTVEAQGWDGMNAIGLTACEAETGIKFTQFSDTTGHVFEHCVEVSFDTDAHYKNFLTRYSPGTKIADTFVIGQVSGTARPQ